MWLRIGLREGKNREVRTILESLGLAVNRLIRTSYGPFQLLDMEPGTVSRSSARLRGIWALPAAELGVRVDEEEQPASGKSPKPQAQGLGMRIVGEASRCADRAPRVASP